MQMFARFAVLAALLAPTVASADVLWAARLAQGQAPAAAAAPAGEPSVIADLAGPSEALSLVDLVKQTLTSSPALARARLDIDLADADVLAAAGIDDWMVDADLRVGESQGRLGPFVIDRQIDASFAAGLTRSLPTGGTVSLHGEASRTDTDAGGTSSVDYTDSVTASWTQPLLAGRGRRVARATLRKAELARDAAALDLRSAANAQLRGAILAYWDLVFSEQDLAIRRASLALARERHRITQAGISGGKLPASELLAAEQAIASRQEEVFAAELAVLEQAIAVRRATGMPIASGKLALATHVDIVLPTRRWDLTGLVEASNRASPELAALAVRDKSAVVDVEVTDNGLLPRLDLALNVGPEGHAETFGEAAERMVTFDGLTALASLRLEHELGNRAAKGANRAARVQRKVIKVTAHDLELQIAEAMTRAVAMARTAEARALLASKTIELAEKNIAVEAARLGLGTATNFDVLQRQDELKLAQLRRARAIVDWHKAEIAIMTLTGGLLDAYGVVLASAPR